VEESLMRSIECAYFIADYDLTTGNDILTASLYATIQSDDDAFAFESATESVSDTSIAVDEISNWDTSCDELVTTNVIALNSGKFRKAIAAAKERNIQRKHRRTTESSCGDSSIAVYYVNGIWSSSTDNFNSLARLRIILNSISESSGTVIAINHIPNPSVSLLSDLLETLILKNAEEGGSLSVSLLNSRTVLRYLISLASTLTFTAVLPFRASTWFTTFVIEYFSDKLSSSIISDFESDINDVTSSIQLKTEDSITHGKAVILIGHSQGNLFINSAYTRLSSTNQNYVSPYAIATPSSYVGSEGTISPYVTRQDDVVINLVRDLKSSLAYNVVPASSALNALGHYLIEAYLSDTTVKSRIKTDLTSIIESVSYPTAISGDGVITITLTWGTNEDVDLHIYEPDGTHVYYADRQNFGIIDTDDVNGEGPENYYISCDNLVAGTYTFGVTYYYGTTAETATVNIKAGLSTRVTTQYLPTAVGSSAMQYTLGTIVVADNDDGSSSFTINLS